MFKLCVVVISLFIPPSLALAFECDGGSATGAIACLLPAEAAANKALNEELAQIAQLMREQGSFVANDEYQKILNSSQASWKKYINEKCLLQGRAKTGPNSWSSYYALECEISSIKSRIDELKHLSDILHMVNGDQQ
jgi:uncharacterized protein YecT (DUF1311 family)